MSSWCWHTRGGASSISTSPPTPARNGQHNRWSRRCLGIMCPVISCGIAMPFMGSRSGPGCGGWASAKCSPRHSLHGKIRTLSASSAPFDFNVTSHPSSEWTAQQMVEALPWDNVPRYLLRDRDAIYGESFRARVRGMGVREVLTAPHSPWQNPYAERLIGSLRRECLDHVTVFNESSLRRLLNLYFTYYLRSRTHLALGKDPPLSRPVQPPALGAVVELP